MLFRTQRDRRWAVQLCKTTQGEFDGVWDDVTKVDVQKAFLGTEKSFAQGTWKRVERIFDRYNSHKP